MTANIPQAISCETAASYENSCPAKKWTDLCGLRLIIFGGVLRERFA